MRKKLLRFMVYGLIIGLMAALSLVLAACSCSPSSGSSSAPAAPIASGGTKYENTTWKYSVQVLQGWTVNSSNAKNVIVSSPDKKADILITSTQYDQNLETFTNYSASVFKQRDPDYKEQSRTQVKVSGLDAYYIKLTYTRSGVALQGVMLVTLKGQNGYVLVGATSPTLWDKYGNNLAAIINSLTAN